MSGRSGKAPWSYGTPFSRPLPLANLAQLKDIGFFLAGRWTLSGDGISFDLDPSWADSRNVLYAFAAEGDLVYVGKSIRTLRTRMQAYQSPAKAPSKAKDTSVMNNRRIREQIDLGRQVEIYILRPDSLLQYRGVQINLAAGMEDALIQTLRPAWNNIGNESHKRDPKMPNQQMHLWLSSRLFQQLQVLAKRNGKSMTAEATVAITNHLQANGLWPPSTARKGTN